jgi:hypothetical protein
MKKICILAGLLLLAVSGVWRYSQHARTAQALREMESARTVLTEHLNRLERREDDKSSLPLLEIAGRRYAGLLVCESSGTFLPIVADGDSGTMGMHLVSGTESTDSMRLEFLNMPLDLYGQLQASVSDGFKIWLNDGRVLEAEASLTYKAEKENIRSMADLENCLTLVYGNEYSRDCSLVLGAWKEDSLER